MVTDSLVTEHFKENQVADKHLMAKETMAAVVDNLMAVKMAMVQETNHSMECHLEDKKLTVELDLLVLQE